MKEEAALTRTIADIRLPGPITQSDVRDIEQALMGDYKNEYYQERGAMIWMPEAAAFEDRLKNSKVDNLNIDSAARRYRFLVPFIIKAELNPGLAFGEGMLNWINFLSRKCWKDIAFKPGVLNPILMTAYCKSSVFFIL